MLKPEEIERIFEATPLPTVVLKADAPRFTILMVNEAYCLTTNTSKSDLVGKGAYEVFPEFLSSKNHQKTTSDFLREVISTRERQSANLHKYNIPIRGTNDFEERYWSLQYSPVLNEKDEVDFIIHHATDITSQVLKEETERSSRTKLIESEQQYRSLFDHHPDAVISFDLKGNFVRVNEGMARMAESSREQILDTSFLPLIASEDSERVSEHFEKATRGEIQKYITRLVTSRGRVVIVDATLIPIVVDEEILGVFGIGRDITKEVEANQKLVEQKEQLRKIMDYSLDVICTIDEHRNIIKINKASKTVLGYKPEELEGTSYLDLISKDERESLISLSDKIRSGAEAPAIENYLKRKDGKGIYMNWSIQWDAEEKISYCIGRDITDLKNSLDRIKNNERRLKTLLRNSSDGLALVDTDGAILEISDSGKKILGYDENDIIGKISSDLIHPDDHPLLAATFNDVLNHPQHVKNVEFRFLLNDGKIKWIEANFQNHLEEPVIHAMVINFRDITERKKALQRLKASEERYRDLFNNNPLPMWLYDTNTYNFLEVNQAAVEKYGYSPEEFLKMSIKDIRPKEDVPAVINSMGKFTDSGFTFNGHWRHYKKNGDLLYVEITAKKISHQGWDTTLILANDVTEKVKAEEAIRSSEEVRRLILNAALDAIICIDMDESIMVWNTQSEKLFGWKKEEVIGQNVADLVIPENLRGEFRNGVKQYFETGDSPIINTLLEKTALHRKYSEFPIEIIMAPIKQGDKEFLCLYVRNISDRKNYIAAIEKQNATLREIAWKQSHVVRAPLSRIIGLVELMKNSSESKDTDEFLDYLSASADELDGIVREIVKTTEEIEKPLSN